MKLHHRHVYFPMTFDRPSCAKRLCRFSPPGANKTHVQERQCLTSHCFQKQSQTKPQMKFK